MGLCCRCCWDSKQTSEDHEPKTSHTAKPMPETPYQGRELPEPKPIETPGICRTSPEARSMPKAPEMGGAPLGPPPMPKPPNIALSEPQPISKPPDKPSRQPRQPPGIPSPTQQTKAQIPGRSPSDLAARPVKLPSPPLTAKPTQSRPGALERPPSNLPPSKLPQTIPTAKTIKPTHSELDGSKHRFPAPAASPPPQRKLPTHLSVENILGQPFKDVEYFYTIGRELGRGQYGITYLCSEKSTGLPYACKSVFKWKLMNPNDKENIGREVQILKHLKGNLNIVEFKEAYEDMQSVHVIMELCSGGGILDRIIDKGHYSESAAAEVFRQVVSAVDACHGKGVMHGDLKPEAFLFVNEDEGASLKLTDFKLSILIEEGKKHQPRVGSAYYVAPEVLQGCYGKEMDVWSAGVILCILLTGVPPFRDDTQKGIFNSISQSHIDFKVKPWTYTSSSAIDLVKRMLTKDPTKRITSAQVLQHPWVIENGEVSNEPIDSAVTAKMKQFKAISDFKKLAPKVVAENLSEEQIRHLKGLFEDGDHNKRGRITYDELKKGLAQFTSKQLENKVKQLISAAEAGGNGTIDHNEFITATLHRHRLERDYNLYKDFHSFDKDKSGFITKDELDRAINESGMGDQSFIKEKIEEVETDGYGRIKYEEMCSVMSIGLKKPT